MESYRKHAMTRNGDLAEGKKIFYDERALCSQCHTLDGSSRLAGPDLLTAGDKFSRTDLILSILNPSANIMTGYALTVVKTKTGESISGIVKESSEAKLVLAAAGELRHTIAKSDIQEQLTSPASMMPPSLHAGLSKDEFSDLITFC